QASGSVPSPGPLDRSNQYLSCRPPPPGHDVARQSSPTGDVNRTGSAPQAVEPSTKTFAGTLLSPPQRWPLCVPVRSSKDRPGGTLESMAARQDCAHKGLRRQVRMVYYVVKDEVWRSEGDVGVANTNLGSTEQVLAAVRGPLEDDRMRAQQI